jgi:predicted Rossmann-fold nucleotide-binding protein
MSFETVDARVSPVGRLGLLSKSEISRLLDQSVGGLYGTFRKCALAVLNSGHTADDGQELLQRYSDFQIRLDQEERGFKLELQAAPAVAFVDGEIIRGIREHLSAVVRDILFAANEIIDSPAFDLSRSEGISDAVFHLLRNADAIRPIESPRLVVCWGGHSISREEYEYSKKVGYQLGLRSLDICTGCGPGAMKGPMKGATIGHAKQRIGSGRYVGISEPGIIAAESPNPIVNELIVMPDIEKRLEAFVRCGHAIIVFPGGVGTAEEILYILGVLLHPDNAGMPFPLIFTGPPSAAEYFEQIDAFIAATLGPRARERYRVVIDDPATVAKAVSAGMQQVRAFRKAHDDAYYFNWLLKIPQELQQPFEPSHENMRQLQLHRDQPDYLIAANLRRAFSGVVAGNVKDAGVRAIERHGPYELRGEPALTTQIDTLLTAFIAQQRMRLPGKAYHPCYRILR